MMISGNLFSGLIKMISLDTILSRRDLIKLGSATAVIIASPQLLTSCAPGRITFEEALADKHNLTRLRQKYIDQLVQEVLIEQLLEVYLIVDGFHYDHDGSLSMSELTRTAQRLRRDPRYAAYINRMLEVDPQFFQQAYREYVQNPRFLTHTREGTVERMRKFLKTEEGLMDWIDKVIDSTIKDAESKKYFVLGQTHFYRFDFGKRIKAKITFPKRIFEPIDYYVKEIPYKIGPYEVKGKTIIIPPTESRIKRAIKHEFGHVSDYFYGVGLGQTIVNGDNISDLDPAAEDALLEGRQSLKDLEYIRGFNKSQGTGFQKYDPAYLGAILDLEPKVRDWIFYSGEKLDPLSRVVFDNMKPKLDRATIEIESVLKELNIKTKF